MQPDLVTNGGFEAGNLSGWTLGGNYTSTTWGPEIFINSQVKAQGGLFAIGLASVTTDGTLSQTLQTTPGQQYTLSFWLANEDSGPNDFSANWNGATVMALTNAPVQDYTQYTFTVTATGTTTVLEFDARQDPSEWNLDSISVTAIGGQGPSAPTITSFSPDTGVVGDGIINATILTLTGSAAANSTVSVYDHAALLGTATVDGSGAWSFATAALPDGTHSFTATDSVAGNISAASSALSVTVDTVPPTDVFTSDIKNSNGSFTVRGQAEAGDTVNIYDGKTDLGST